MKKYILFLTAIFATMTAMAYDMNYAGCYKSVKLNFMSTDENNKPILLSELVTLPYEKDCSTYRNIGFFVLSSMPFNTKEEKTSSGSQPLDALLLRTIATEGAATVQIDGQGFGSSSGGTVPFLINKVNARQSIDGLFAAMDYINGLGINVSDSYYTINAGFSLAGGRSIAIQRYLEKYSSAEEKARFRLKQTICGGAPINAVETAKFIINNNVGGKLSQYMSFFDGFVKANAHGSLHAFKTEDLFDADENVKEDVLNGTSSAGRAFWKALAKENMDEDWTPETPIKSVHFTDDSIVTYKNAEIAIDKWGKKFQIIDRDMAGMKWNISALHPVSEALRTFLKEGSHYTGASNYYIGMIDGCLRDTVIADMYGKITSYKDVLAMLFDLGSALNVEIPVNINTTIQNGTLTIKTLGNCRMTGDIETPDISADLDITMKPEVWDTLHSDITDVEAKGYLHLPIDFTITLNDVGGLIDIPFYGSCRDLYELIENLSAVILHHRCPTKEEAKKYCDAINDCIQLRASLPWPLSDVKVVASYEYDRSDSTYVIGPYTRTKNLWPWKDDDYTKLEEALSKWVDITPYMTIDKQKISVAEGYEAVFHLTEERFGEIKFYADILHFDPADTLSEHPDTTLFGRVDFDVTGVDMNEDGTRQTFAADFTAVLNEIPAKVVGHCTNLNDAILSAILCYSNLSCPTEEQAQAYADAVNDNVQLEFYVAKVNDDGTYPDELTYIDYGPVKASTTQDEHGAYYVQYCLNWMGKLDIPLMAVIKQLFK